MKTKGRAPYLVPDLAPYLAPFLATRDARDGQRTKEDSEEFPMELVALVMCTCRWLDASVFSQGAQGLESHGPAILLHHLRGHIVQLDTSSALGRQGFHVLDEIFVDKARGPARV